MADVYESLDELKSHKVEDIDYEETLRDRNSKVTVLSIHGGFVEFGTSEIAEEIAGDDFNYFNFGALKRENRWGFHVTSHNFYQEDLETVLKNSDTEVSIHGCVITGSDRPLVCVGGLDEKLKKLIKDRLESAGFETSTKYFPAIYRLNVANRAKNGGVQLELTYSLRKTLFEDINQRNRKPNEKFYLFTDAVRSAIEEYLDTR